MALYDSSKNLIAGKGGGGGGASTLNDLTDVTLTSPASGQVLKYNGSEWVNGSGGGGVVQKAVLLAGNTTIVFPNIPTSGDYTVDFFNSLGISYTSITPSSGSVTLVYPEQSVDMAVYCEIKEV